MKEIKFRTRRIARNNTKQYCNWEYFTLEDLIGGRGQFYANDYTDWCEYTGLKDKNGKEIYESDHLMSDKGLHMTVFWSNARACYSVRFLNIWGKRTDKFFYKSLWWASTRSKVIGNIYEKELIK